MSRKTRRQQERQDSRAKGECQYCYQAMLQLRNRCPACGSKLR